MKAGVWLRVSTELQDEANQLPEILAWCKAKGYDVVTPYYQVHGKSAFHGKQQKYLDQVLADMAIGKIQVLVVWASDRIERRGAESVFDLARKVREAGGRIEYVKDAYLNDTNEMSDVMLAMAATKDRQESKRKSDRIKASLAAMRASGVVTGKAPWGYRIEGVKYSKKLVPTELGKQWVPVIFEMVAQGRSLSEVRQFLTRSGVKPGTKKQDGTPGTWWQTLVGDMIRNTTYFGQQQDAKGNVIHRCEALVTLALWERANKALTAANKNTTARGAGSLPRAMLAGALFCGHCADSPMYRIFAGNKGYRYAYYRCAGGRGADRQSCGNMVRLDAVDNAVNEIAARTFFAPVMRLEVVAGRDYDAELSEVREQLRTLTARLLPRDEEQAERERLWALEDELTGREGEPDGVREVPTGETYAGLWSALPAPERGPWLKSQGFRVSATKDVVALSQPGHAKGVKAMVNLREQTDEMEVAA